MNFTIVECKNLSIIFQLKSLLSSPFATAPITMSPVTISPFTRIIENDFKGLSFSSHNNTIAGNA